MVSLWLSIIAALLAVLISALAYVLVARTLPTGSHGSLIRHSSVIICGPSGTGKTRLFLELVSPQHPATVVSATLNIAPLLGHDKFRLVDVPGSSKVREGLFAQVIASARSIVLLVDGGRLDYLYQDIAFIMTILAESCQKRLSLLIVLKCTPADLPSRKNALVHTLTAELHKVLRRVLEAHAEDDETDHESTIKRNAQLLLKAVGAADDVEELSFEALSARIHAEIIDDQSVEAIKNWILAH